MSKLPTITLSTNPKYGVGDSMVLNLEDLCVRMDDGCLDIVVHLVEPIIQMWNTLTQQRKDFKRFIGSEILSMGKMSRDYFVCDSHRCGSRNGVIHELELPKSYGVFTVNGKELPKQILGTKDELLEIVHLVEQYITFCDKMYKHFSVELGTALIENDIESTPIRVPYDEDSYTQFGILRYADGREVMVDVNHRNVIMF